MDSCLYIKTSSDGYGANWTTECGRTIRIKAPIEVGCAPAPLPNIDGAYCHYCGRLIKLET